MKCLVCKTAALKPIYLEDGLPAHICEADGGVWISATDYMAWLGQHRPISSARPLAETSLF